MRAGADDFVVKPVSPERLKVSMQNLLRVNALTEEVKRLNQKAGGHLTFADLIAAAPAMQNVARLVRRGAQSSIPILIEGESGVGKEMIARAIQGESDRRGRPFVAVNCGAIPENLVESILFGHEKGAFTGATGRHVGKFQEADGGTLFLDEVAELPLDMQVKLLRAIQEGEVDPVGRKASGQGQHPPDFRHQPQHDRDGQGRAVSRGPLLPAQCLSDPRAAIARAQAGHSGAGRSLHHSLLRRRGPTCPRHRPAGARDAPRLCAGPAMCASSRTPCSAPSFSCEGDILEVEDFPQIASLVEGYEVKVPAVPPLPLRPPLATGHAAMTGAEGQIISSRGGVVGDGIAVGIPAVTDGGHIRRLEEVEADMIRMALQRYRGQMSEVARKLGIGRSTLYRKMRGLGLEAKM